MRIDVEAISPSQEPPGLIGALQLRKLGLAPVVLRARGEVYRQGGKSVVASGKEPRYRQFGRRARTANAARLRADYTAHPTSGVGVLLGVLPPGPKDDPKRGRPGVMDLEVDDPAAAAEPLRRIWPQGPPETLRYESHGAGRWHYLFRIDDEVAQALKGMGIITAGFRGRHEAAPLGDPAYAGLEFRFGALSAADELSVQSVVPPTPRADGTPRVWVGTTILPFPAELLADLQAHSAIARGQARPARRPKGRARSRAELEGLAPIEKMTAQFQAIGQPLTPTGEPGCYSACCTNPTHQDRRPSMTLRVVTPSDAIRTADGQHRSTPADTVLVCCHSRGCPVEKILAGLGLWVADLYPDCTYRKAQRLVPPLGLPGKTNRPMHRPAPLDPEVREDLEQEFDRSQINPQTSASRRLTPCCQWFWPCKLQEKPKRYHSE